MDCATVRELMLDVLYGEAEGGPARDVGSHLAGCDGCQAEMASLRQVRRQLAAWTLPAGAVARPPARALGTVGALAWAASVLLAFTSAFALSGSEARLADGRLSVRFGHGTETPDVATLLSEQEDRHQREIASLRASLQSPPVAPTAADREALLRDVQDLIRQSEDRQVGRMDDRLAALSARADAQRRYDLARVSAGLSYLEGKTGRDVAKTAELVSYVLQAKQQR